MYSDWILWKVKSGKDWIYLKNMGMNKKKRKIIIILIIANNTGIYCM